MYAEDMELCARLHDTGWRVVLEPAAEVVHVGNVAGAAEFGAARDAQWLRATYDWSSRHRGTWRTRSMALAWSAGLALKWTIWRLRQRPDQARRVASELREHVRHIWA
jgi:GT2 family glycosyltransferase